MISECEDVLYAADTLLGNLRDMDHALFAGCKFDESAELFDGDNGALKDLSLLEIGIDDFDVFLGLVHIGLIGTADKDIVILWLLLQLGT